MQTATILAFGLSLLAYGVLSADLKKAVVGCSTIDHQTCDELCKQDNYWYGHCTAWDGRDFQCRCYEYKSPADGSLCANQQRYCMDICQKKGAEGGYCYPQPSAKAPRGTPKCQCFKALPDTST